MDRKTFKMNFRAQDSAAAFDDKPLLYLSVKYRKGSTNIYSV